MRRLFWMGVGIAITIVVVRKVKTWADQQPVVKVAMEGQETIAGMNKVAQSFVGEFNEARTRREAELRASLLASAAS